MVIREQALPKINLLLDVRGRRSNGYHDILTVFLPLRSPVDSVRLEETDSTTPRLLCHSQEVPSDGTNLCLRALEAFCAATGTCRGWRIDLVKRIPVAAGLGGGSSDAAAVLRALNRARGGVLSQGELHRLALSLGADVPFFLQSCPALAEGIGERLQPIACEAQLGIVLACPGFPVSAGWAYEHWHGDVRARPDVAPLLRALAHGDAGSVSALLYNDLEAAVLRKFPLAGMIVKTMKSAGCHAAHVSGSGPSVFGVGDVSRVSSIARALRREFGSALTVFESAPACASRPTSR